MSIRFTLPMVILVCLSTNTFAQKSADDKTEADVQPEAKYVIESGEVVVVTGEERLKIELPAKAVAVLVRGDKLYVALGSHGAALYDVSDPNAPTLIRRVDPGREQVTGFIVVNGEVWMRIVSTAAVPVDSGAVARHEPAVIVTEEPAKLSESQPEDKELGSAVNRSVAILGLRPGEVKLDAGTKDGVKVGDRFSVFRKIEIKDEVDGEGSFEGRELAAVIEVTAVNEESSLAEVWRGDRVTMENEVEPADKDHDTSLMLPHRLEHLAEVSIVLRPILDVSTGGVGGLCDLSVNYVGGAWFAAVSVQPVGFGFTERGSLFSTIAVAEGGYDGRAFGLGAGAGISVNVAKARAGWKEEEEKDAKSNEGWSEDDTGFVLSQVIRMGPRDGLNFTGRNTLINFEWGGAHGTIDIPLTGRTALFLEGGGSAVGYGMGALGISTWLRGNGDKDSIGLSVSAGFAAVWVQREEEDEKILEPLPEDEPPPEDDGDWDDDNYGDSVTALGPMVSIGLDYRFGF